MAKVNSDQNTDRSPRTSRRTFLKGAAAAVGVAAFSAACAPATPQVIEKQVEVTKEVEKEVPVTVQVEVQKEVPVTVQVTSVPAQEVINIRYSSTGWGGWLSEPWQQVIDNFNKSQSAIQVPKGYEDVAEGTTKVMAEAAGGVAADVYLFETKYMQSFAALGFFLPIDEYVAGSQVVKKDLYFAQDWAEMFWGGHQRMAPFDNSPAMVWYNPELFDAAGVPYPPNKVGGWKWEDFLATSQKMTKGEGAERVFGWNGERWWVYSLPWIWSNGGWFLNEQKTACVVDSPESVAALQWAQDLIHKHKVQPTASDLGEGGTSAMFYMKRAAMAQKGTWWAIDLKAQEGLKWNVAPMPEGPGGTYTRNPLDAWGIWTGSANKDASWTLIDFLSTDEQLKVLTLAGLSVSKRKVMEEVFEKQEPTNVDWHLFREMLDGHIRPHPDTAVYNEMQDLITPEWDKVLEGTTTPAQYAAAIVPPINDLLAACISKGECEGGA